jgi:hypothetical protein
LRDLDRGSVVDVGEFSNELEFWPYCGDPAEASTASVMFWAFKEEDRCDWLKSHFKSYLNRIARTQIEHWPTTERQLVLEACSFDDEFRPARISEIQKRNAAVGALENELISILTDHDTDVLLD